MKTCKNCGEELNSYQQKYCSNKCQMELVQKLKVSLWLETGECLAGSSKGHYVRTYIHEQQNGLCDVCGCPDWWNEQELIFILDHIDGNSENNSRDNLRLVCPNCDSQLPTFKSRNMGKGRFARRKRYLEGKSY
jgi:hypothetical protein